MADPLQLRPKVATARDGVGYGAPQGRPHLADTAASINSRSSVFSAVDCARVPSSMRRLFSRDSAALASCQSSAALFKNKQAQATTKTDAIRTAPAPSPSFFGQVPNTNETTGIIGRITPAKTKAAITILRDAYGTKFVAGSKASKTIAGPPAIAITASNPSQIVWISLYAFPRFTLLCRRSTSLSLLGNCLMLTCSAGEE